MGPQSWPGPPPQLGGLGGGCYVSAQLNAFDRNVILMIDEIYVSKRIEAGGGQIFGLTEDCEVASTALCFMIKSLSSKYRDIGCIHPVRNLKANTQKQCFDKVMYVFSP